MSSRLLVERGMVPGFFFDGSPDTVTQLPISEPSATTVPGKNAG